MLEAAEGVVADISRELITAVSDFLTRSTGAGRLWILAASRQKGGRSDRAESNG